MAKTVLDLLAVPCKGRSSKSALKKKKKPFQNRKIFLKSPRRSKNPYKRPQNPKKLRRQRRKRKRKSKKMMNLELLPMTKKKCARSEQKKENKETSKGSKMN